MCGRCRCTLSEKQSVEYAKGTVSRGEIVRVDGTFASFVPSYNISPGQRLPILCRGDNGVTLQSAVWGLVPHFQKSRQLDHFKMFNARSEELGAKPSFAGLVGRKRCVVLCEGFFEWDSKRVLGKMEKQPYFVYLDGERGTPAVMAMAGLYDVWRDPETDEDLVTCTILTTSSSSELSWLHDRMPVILADTVAVANWLDTETHRKITRDMIRPYESGGKGSSSPQIKFHKVTQKMSKTSFQGAECVARLKPVATLAKFFSSSARQAPGKKARRIGETDDGLVKEEKER